MVGDYMIARRDKTEHWESVLCLDRILEKLRSFNNIGPVTTNPDNYKVIFENDQVRVLEYTNKPGHFTIPHDHPDSVMYTLSSFRRRLISDKGQAEVEIKAGTTAWLAAQKHTGENIGNTDTHVIFVELEGSHSGESTLGPQI
jgi:quercetin dioxygenase-like cupin family protein